MTHDEMVEVIQNQFQDQCIALKNQMVVMREELENKGSQK